MKAVMIMFDSLNRAMLPNYGSDETIMPNFEKLNEKVVTFDNCYVGSLPCMPARREIHTGRLNFLHRGWGPLEPFDDSMPELLKRNGIYTHIVTDHTHYWEDGGATYHNRYSTYEFIRGQEGDHWVGQVKDEPLKDLAIPPFEIQKGLMIQDVKNVNSYQSEDDTCIARTFHAGIDFIERNKEEDHWFLTIESFDPHEPFYAPQKYRDLYEDFPEGKDVYWPPYDFVKEDESVVNHARYEYKALMSMCDAYLGKVLDIFDQYNLWEDTMLIINTDHGYLLGEHDWWSKTVMPVYDEIAHTPFFIYDPRFKNTSGERREALVQTIDIAPTLLEFFNVDIPNDMMGKPLRETVEKDLKVRDYAMFGFHEGHINVTDGRYVYMRGPVSIDNRPLYEHTLMPCNMRSMFSVDSLKQLELGQAYSFTKGIPLMKVPSDFTMCQPYNFGTKLYDLQLDPKQVQPLDDLHMEHQMMNALLNLMWENDAPMDQYERLGIDKIKELSLKELIQLNEISKENSYVVEFENFEFIGHTENQLKTLLQFIPKEIRHATALGIKENLEKMNINTVNQSIIDHCINTIIPEPSKFIVSYFVSIASRNN